MNRLIVALFVIGFITLFIFAGMFDQTLLQAGMIH